MSMSTNVVGFAPPDETWQRMRAIWDACRIAEVEPPQEVIDFFDGEEPDERGVLIDQYTLEKCGAVKTWRGDMQEGYEIEIAKLPRKVKFVRVYNAY